uniref:Uncharacterized protein n=1 Tax=Panagrolaimus davidi TaxID=227884 RepID=A0A914QIB1_9BILA
MDIHIVTEAHYFSIDENNLSNITLVDKVVLTDFHDGALKDIFNNEFNQQYSPTFQSYGRQVFVRIKLLHEPEKVRIAQDGDRVIWHGLWKNDKEYEVHNRDFKWKLPKFNLNLPEFSLVFIDDINVLFYAKKSWIQKDIPVLPYKTAANLPPKETNLPPAPPVNPDPPATMPPENEPTTLSPKDTTNLPPVNPGPPATIPPENEPTNVPPTISTTILQPTEPTILTSTVPATTTTSPLALINSSISNTIGNGSSSNTKNTTSQILPKPEAQIQNNKTLSEEDASSKDNNACSLFDKNLGWFLISIVIIVLAEIIILVNLIVFKFRGAKKLKEAMAKKKVQKSGKKNKMKPSKKKKQKTSTKEKSTKEKSVTKTEDAGKTTASEAPKTTTVEQTNYFAVNETSKK